MNNVRYNYWTWWNRIEWHNIIQSFRTSRNLGSKIMFTYPTKKQKLEKESINNKRSDAKCQIFKHTYFFIFWNFDYIFGWCEKMAENGRLPWHFSEEIFKSDQNCMRAEPTKKRKNRYKSNQILKNNENLRVSTTPFFFKSDTFYM